MASSRFPLQCRILVFALLCLGLNAIRFSVCAAEKPPSPCPPHEPKPCVAKVPADVAIGHPIVTPYSRIFPLMAGLLQDFGAMQVTQLQVASSPVNASNLDAVLQQFALSAQFSQTMGIQNAAAAQQFAVTQQTNSLQSSLIAQESQLYALQTAAQQQLLAAQTAQANLPANPTPAQTATAAQAVTLANDNLTSVTAQLANLKAALPATSTSNSFSPPFGTSTTAPTPAIQTPTVSPATPGGANFTASFPALKQIDNQTSVLWERLVRLVSLLAEDANQERDEISLVEFHTDPTSGGARRKHELLTTEYRLSCSLDTAIKPRIVDLYPRTAAVNIANEKYKDNRFGIAALVSFFSLGVNAAYNREHLRISQVLSESSYITGFGIQRSDFGWVFGPSLGEDAVTAGDRDTFALVAAPNGCGTAVLGLVNAAWDKEPAVKTPSTEDVKPADDYNWPLSISTKNEKDNEPTIKSLSYTPTDFDQPAVAPAPGAGAAAATPVIPTVVLDVELGDGAKIDSQATLSANGAFLKRSLDNFLRGTVAATGTNVPASGGLLEDYSGFAANTWIPISQTEMIITLNATQFPGQFPSLRLNSPAGSIDLTGKISPATNISVAGRALTCVQGMPPLPCARMLPPVGHPKATGRQILAKRWDANDEILITAGDAPTQQTAASAAPVTTTAVQLITSSGRQPWSTGARVLALQDGAAVSLPCEADGERLRCSTSALPAVSIDPKKALTLEVTDPVYDRASVNGPASISGSVNLPDCTGVCTKLYVWQIEQPKWEPLDRYWNFRLSLINVDDGDEVQLGKIEPRSPVHCAGPKSEPCSASIKILLSNFDEVRDLMDLGIYPKSGGGQLNGGKIGNLRTLISPVLKSINNDQTQFTGQNLVFDQISVTPTGKLIPLQCSTESDCFLSGFGATDEGYLYFRPQKGATPGDGRPVPFAIAVNGGSPQAVPAHHPAKAAPGAAAPAPVVAPAPAPPPPVKGVGDIAIPQITVPKAPSAYAIQ